MTLSLQALHVPRARHAVHWLLDAIKIRAIGMHPVGVKLHPPERNAPAYSAD